MSHDLFQIKSNYGLAVDVCYDCVLSRVQNLQLRNSNHLSSLAPSLGALGSVALGFSVRDSLNHTFDDRLRLCSINMLTLSCIAAASSNVSGRL